ncbi:hypothetical protein RND81_03G192500 [Saponaria officinalis]|uniref:Uncharacterized protein n=1 Tax=Saponaria officinalis TaxID=3572 RepID=A0AAW1MBT8_SAPOF
MAESSNKNLTDEIPEPSIENPFDISEQLSKININTPAESPITNPIDITQESPTSETDADNSNYDFVLQLTTDGKNKMRLAISALKNTEFNPSKMGLMRVTKAGFSITVKSTIDPTNEKDYVFGYLRMRAADLDHFYCQETVSKVVPLRDVLRVLKAANFESRAVIYGVQGSNQLSFDFDHLDVDGRTIDQTLHVNLIDDINSEYENFPNVLYEYKETITAASLWKFVVGILRRPRVPSDHSVKMEIKTNRVIMEVGEAPHYHRIREPAMTYEVSWTWRHWRSLAKALCKAEFGCIYLVNVPAQSVMLKLKLSELGDVVYLYSAEFTCNSKDPRLNQGLYRTIS